MRFYFRKSISPTYHQLNKHLKSQGWRSMPYPSWAQVGEQHFDFDINASTQLEYKHLLANLSRSVDITMMPKTYYIDDQNWSEVIEHLARYDDKSRWILKPSLLNNGQHIHLFETIDQLEAHYVQSKRLSGPHVLQCYIDNPHLLRGHKYSIRVFVVLTNDMGGFLFPEGYLNVARYPYQYSFAESCVHLTNEHLMPDQSNVIQIPATRLALFSDFYISIKSKIAALLSLLIKQHPSVFGSEQSRRFAIYGFDFLVDSNHKVWLLEANHGPCFPTIADHPIQRPVYDRFWHAFIVQFLEPLAKGAAFISDGAFEALV